MKTSILPIQQEKHNVITLMLSLPSNTTSTLSKRLLLLLGNNLDVVDTDLLGARPPLSPSDLPRHRSSINDSYCAQSVTGQIEACVSGVVTNLNVTGKNYCLKTRTQLPVICHVASHVLFAGGLSQKKEHQMSIKSMKGASCVDQLSSVQNVTMSHLLYQILL